ncbi:hypothetical protein C8P66_11225 [Humitalea rosea]|uniref:Uncharacterized protein n=1 Tax=Humitalea rosea TaxID=990373 RepID=A0A2W7IDM5_9PROT|nr:hypothetical protein [Humitalea rosea]PZW45010.1 hypothetical protein C8P66_11225 [Humitalea rosea]
MMRNDERGMARRWLGGGLVAVVLGIAATCVPSALPAAAGDDRGAARVILAAGRGAAPAPDAMADDVCDTPGPRPMHHVAFNLSEPEDPDAVASLQRALQLCVRSAPRPGAPEVRGPIRRG